MKKLLILFLSATLSGCSIFTYTLFGEKPEVQEPADFSFNAVPLKKDFYGRPIFAITFSQSSTDYGQALYHALNQSISRNPNAFFLIATYSDTSFFAEKQALDLRREMENLGINPAKVIIKHEKRTAGEPWDSVKLYER